MLKKYLLIFLGALSWSLTMVKSGWVYPYGAGFWGPNGHDGIWHIALAERLARGSWEMPVFAGEAIKNYHLGLDLLLAFLHKISSFPISILYFQILPPIFALAIGLLTYEFVYLWKHSTRHSLLATFFVYFGGSLGWVLGKGESAFWSQQAISTLINPPFALSLILILSGLITILKYQKTHATYYLLLATFLFGVLVQVKIYAGLLVLGGLFVAGLYSLITEHRPLFTKIFLSVLATSLLIYLPFNKFSTGLIVFYPFWFLETMMQLTDRVGWVKFGEAMINYRLGYVWLKGILAYGVAFVIFIVGNFGMRLISVKYYVSSIKSKLSDIDVFFAAICFAGILIPLFFLQKGTPWNTIQFMYYSLFFSGILAGVALSHTTYYLILATILLTIPTSVLTLKDVYLPSRPPAMLPKEELAALSFLKSQPDGVVLTYPFDRQKAKEAESHPPRPLYLYESSAYVSAYSAKPVFLEDEVNLDITGYPWRERRVEIEKWYKEKDQAKAREFLKKNKIKYIYWLKGQRALLGETQLGIEKIFENKEVNVFVVKS